MLTRSEIERRKDTQYVWRMSINLIWGTYQQRYYHKTNDRFQKKFRVKIVNFIGNDIRYYI